MENVVWVVPCREEKFVILNPHLIRPECRRNGGDNRTVCLLNDGLKPVLFINCRIRPTFSQILADTRR